VHEEFYVFPSCNFVSFVVNGFKSLSHNKCPCLTDPAARIERYAHCLP